MEENRPAQADLHLPDRPEACLAGSLYSLLERLGGNVEQRLYQKETRAGFEQAVHFAQKGARIPDFVHHPKRQGEIGWTGYTQAPGLGAVQFDAMQHSGLGSLAPDALQHLFLQVYGNNPAPIADITRQRDGEITCPAANIQDRLAWGYQAVQEAVGRVYQ
jgi:hypothetical protein